MSISLQTLSILMVALLSASPTIDDWYVDVGHPDCADGDGSASAPFCTIKAALQRALTGDTIHIAPGTYPENLRSVADDVILTNDGLGVVIVDGQEVEPVFKISGHRITLQGLTITGGFTPDQGAGVVLHDGGSLIMVDCEVSGNRGSHNELTTGGGIYAGFETTLTLINTTISDNSAAIGRGIAAENATIELTDCLIQD